MEPNRFLFKLTAIFIQYVLLILIISPFVYFSQLLKYDFQKENVVVLKVLFLAIAIAMPIVVANAFAFAKFDRLNLLYYLKSKQKHEVVTEYSKEEIKNNILNAIQEKPFWTLITQSENEIIISIKSLMVSDRVTININTGGDKQTHLTIESRPNLSFLFIDFARNYRNILQVLTASHSKSKA